MSAPRAGMFLLRHPGRSADAGMDIWWKAGRSGYTSDIAEAGAYAPQEAWGIAKSSDGAEPVQITGEVLAAMASSIWKRRNAARDRLRSALDGYDLEMKHCWALEQSLATLQSGMAGRKEMASDG